MSAAPIRVYLCECGPILKGAMDLDLLAERLIGLPEVEEVVRHATLCSPDGREWLTGDLAKRGDRPTVIAACSPREHGDTFLAAARAAGVNPYLLALASIREQVAWVTPDREAALRKAELLVRAAVRRAAVQQPLEEQDIDCNTDVLVVGGGVAGLTAARLLAQADRNVILVEQTAAVGGRAALLSDLYPGLECASCVLEPLMDDVLHHEKVKVLTCSELTGVLGFHGNFTAQIRRGARPVNPELCYGCYTCHGVCPVTVPNPNDGGLSERKAIHVPYTGALPNVSVVDEHCLRLRGEECDACVTACPFGAIDFSAMPQDVEFQVGAVIVASGAECRLPAQWCGQTSVIDTATLERMLSSAGPTGGEPQLPGQPPPRSVALIHDPGAQDQNAAADAQLRAMTVQKLAGLLRKKLPDVELHELLTAGTPYAAPAPGAGERPTRHWLSPTDRVAVVEDTPEGARIEFTRLGKPESLTVDLAVVAPPMRGTEANPELGALLGAVTTESRFFRAEDPLLSPFRAGPDGVFVAGCAGRPMGIGESAATAAAAAGGVLSALIPGRRLSLTPTSARVDAERCGSCRTCLSVCQFHAVQVDAETNQAAVNELICRGCGCCAAACPSNAITALHYTDDQLNAEMNALLESDFGE
ncbi:MAG: FAD-dependent oxidoreductase [bacterium]